MGGFMRRKYGYMAGMFGLCILFLALDRYVEFSADVVVRMWGNLFFKYIPLYAVGFFLDRIPNPRPLKGRPVKMGYLLLGLALFLASMPRLLLLVHLMPNITVYVDFQPVLCILSGFFLSEAF